MYIHSLSNCQTFCCLDVEEVVGGGEWDGEQHQFLTFLTQPNPVCQRRPLVIMLNPIRIAVISTAPLPPWALAFPIVPHAIAVPTIMRPSCASSFRVDGLFCCDETGTGTGAEEEEEEDIFQRSDICVLFIFHKGMGKRATCSGGGGVSIFAKVQS